MDRDKSRYAKRKKIKYLVLSFVFLVTSLGFAAENEPKVIDLGKTKQVYFYKSSVNVTIPAKYIVRFEQNNYIETLPFKNAPIIFRLSLHHPPPDFPGRNFVEQRANKNDFELKEIGNKVYTVEKDYSTYKKDGISMEYWCVGFDNYVVGISATISTNALNNPEVIEALNKVPEFIESLKIN